MSSDAVLLEKREDIAFITLNRPPVNALNTEAFHRLKEIIEDLEADDSIKAVVITGAGEKAFAAGIDLVEVSKYSTLEMYNFCSTTLTSISCVEKLEKPTIAAINGLALGGGCELSLACDFRIAAENASFGQPEIQLGIIPGGGGTQRLPRLIGVSRAKELMYFGDHIDSATAEKYGLVNKVVSNSELMDEAEKWAKKLASKPGVAIRMLKKAVDYGQNMDLEAALQLEIKAFSVTFSTEDRQEGISAMLEKRKPEFKDK